MVITGLSEPTAPAPARAVPVIPTVYYPRVNSWAVVALVAGLTVPLLGWFILPVPIAIVAGHIALSQIRRTHQGGRGMAITGLLFGYAPLALVALLLGGTLLVNIVFFFRT